ncbi:Aminoacyl-histidine dipeptidase [Sulfurovum sp. enrichment culture clone C5]|uniref:Aminoacyl-histidine dipeptidase n=1 Tax=Sulfurovum sp. enrichment culture clone C5 TaxID=497650 RepID=A0A0S4XQ72_9BACT|nr:Aminoacyl-histidine dipeptidase [Sulfurovum sp. enrichment culture clone C5]
MSKIIEHFIALSKIPHCSNNANNLKTFLADFAKQLGYEVSIDNVNNLLIKKGNPKLALQAHYDMVCVGDAPDIEVYEEHGYLKAKNSSLGADNGMAIAMMMVLMEDKYELEFLFTSDEEVGLIGANEVDFNLKAKYMLNLDSEEEGEICIGCAGGIDIKATKSLTKITNNKNCFEVSLLNLPGGHSGVDIDKNIPNALFELASFLKDKNVKIVNFHGGERTNSIPANAKAVITSDDNQIYSDIFSIKKVEKYAYCYDEDILSIISNFKHGVLEFDDSINIPNISQNLAIVDIKDDVLSIEVSIRAMSMDDLDRTAEETSKYFTKYGFDVQRKDKYPAWKPEINDFVKSIEKIMNEEIGRSEIKAIHAGLECGVLKQRYSNIEFASIGPTIYFPHSKQEMIEINSISSTFKVVKRIIEKFNI